MNYAQESSAALRAGRDAMQARLAAAATQAERGPCQIAILEMQLELLGRDLREREASLDACMAGFVANSSEGFIIYAAIDGGDDFVFHIVNSAVERHTGLSRQQLLGQRLTTIFPGVRESALLPAMQRVWRGGAPESLPLWQYRDERFSAWIRNYVGRLPSGEVAVLFDDVSARHQAELAVQENEEKYRKLFETRPDATILFDAASRRVLDVNQPACELYGYSRSEFLGLVMERITAELEATQAVVQRVVAGEAVRVENRIHRRRDGTAFPVEVFANSFVHQGHQVLCASVRDISAQQRARAQILAQRDQLRRLTVELSLAEEQERRRIATGLHDDVAQLLTACSLKLGALSEARLSERARRLNVEAEALLREASGKIRSLTFELSSAALHELGLFEGVRDLCDNLTRQFGIPFQVAGHSLHTEVPRELAVVAYQLLRELLHNVAKHAQAHQAIVTLTVCEDNLCLSVTDDGRGFEARDAGTSIPSAGGLGLFNIRQRLTHLGGQMEIRSGVGRGTCVEIAIPLNVKRHLTSVPRTRAAPLPPSCGDGI